VVVPLVLGLIGPRSVIDVGCGTGGWLATFARHGVTDYLGVDRFAPAGLLEIPRDRFVEADLTRPLAVGRRFDLAVSLEVAEHLPDSAAKTLVESLTRLAPVVLFSAAIPGQGGISHVNEQWPEYWSRLFADYGFDPADVVRPRIWKDERVEFWYAQNSILYVVRNQRVEFPGLRRAPAVAEAPLAAVHPRMFADRDLKLSETVRAHTDATAKAERLNQALASEREHGRSLVDRVERLERSLAEEHARVEVSLAKVAQYRAQATAARLQAEESRQEAERHRAEAAEARERIEASGLEAQRHRLHAERLQTELAGARTEREALSVELERYRFLAEPSNMSAWDYLRALPQVVRGALRRAKRRCTPERRRP
jgi:SAM-dependent methyltransferase